MGATRRVVSRELFDSGPREDAQGKGLPKRSELMRGSTLFPERLLQLADVPKVLHALGEVSALTTPTIAIVGARKATAYGVECASRFARKAAGRGITVVSGGAIGCDMAAHRGALEASGTTVVVLGSGADVVYPLRARSLFKDVLAEGGALVSEAPWGSPPLAWAFSKRNRIIAALAKATLIVEAGLPSGTFQTADHTLALGNEVLVVPGPIFSKESRGSNRLLVQGALPVVDDESFDDALTQIFGLRPQASQRELPLGMEGKEGAAPPAGDYTGTQEEGSCSLGPQELRLRHLTEHVMRDLRANPMTIDALVQATGRDAVEIIRIISRLEVLGKVERLRDGRYTAKPE